MSLQDQDDIPAMRARVFISYKHTNPDQVVAEQLHEGLSRRYDAFIDAQIPVGAHWARQINQEIEQADFFVILLSKLSVQSEMVIGELEVARDLAAERGNNRPRILPVRVGYQDRLPYPLNAYFQFMQWIEWHTPLDTPLVVERLMASMAHNGQDDHSDQGPPPLPGVCLPIGWPPPKGALPLDSPYYVERQSDARVHSLMRQHGVTISIRGPRQIGKTSLLARGAAAARAQGKQVAWIDFQLFEKSALADSRAFYQQFCGRISAALGLEPPIETYWSDGISDVLNCERYITRYVLPRAAPLVLALDEVDRVLEACFCSDFFGMLRSWHNRRTEPHFRQLDLVLVASTEPHLWIPNLMQSPFNVAEQVYLDDFTPDNVDDLNRRYGSPLREDQLRRLTALVGGHPYLVHYAIYAIASGSYDAEWLFARALSDEGPFGDHLNHLLFRLYGKPELTKGLRRIIDTRTCRDQRIYYRLNGAGLVRREDDRRRILPSRQLYADFFDSRLERCGWRQWLASLAG